MQSLKLNNGDLVFEGGQLVLIDGGEELAQCTEIVLSTNRGEWFLNPELGIDFGKLLGKNTNEDAVKQQIRRGLQQEPRIRSVDSITVQFDPAERVAAVSFAATGEDGERIEREVTPSA